MRKNFRIVVLFNEVEKAHPDVQHLLLQILEEGRINDFTRFAISFFDAVILVTSNVSSFAILEESTSIGRGQVNLKAIVKKTLQEEFAPEY